MFPFSSTSLVQFWNNRGENFQIYKPPLGLGPESRWPTIGSTHEWRYEKGALIITENGDKGWSLYLPLSHSSSFDLLKLSEATWLAAETPEKASQVVNHHPFSTMVVHSGQRPPLHLSQTVCFLSPDIVNISESFLSPLINLVESCVALALIKAFIHAVLNKFIRPTPSVRFITHPP